MPVFFHSSALEISISETETFHNKYEMVISICCALQCLGCLAWAPVILSGIQIASDCFNTSVLVT